MTAKKINWLCIYAETYSQISPPLPTRDEAVMAATPARKKMDVRLRCWGGICEVVGEQNFVSSCLL
jgi:hypothetical protein